MSKTANYLTALVFGATAAVATAGPQEECMQAAADKFHPGTLYLAHKEIMTGSAAAFAVPATLTLPSTAKHGLHPIFTKSTAGIVTMTTQMSTVYFHDIHPYSISNSDPALTAENIDDIGFLTSPKTQGDGGIRPDEARSKTLTPALNTFVDSVRTCLKP